MEIATLVSVLDQPHLAADHLAGWGLANRQRGQQVLLELAESGLTLDLLAGVCRQLAEHLPATQDPDAALVAFRRYLFAVRSPLALAALLERDDSAMPMLLAALSLGRRWTDLLVDDPEAFDLLRQTDRQPVDASVLQADLLSETSELTDERSLVAALRPLRERHLLRIAFAEIVHAWPLETVVEQLSQLEDSIIATALAAAHQRTSAGRNGKHDSAARRLCVIAIGRLGAEEADYASPLHLLLAYDAASNGQIASREDYERIALQLQRCLKELRGRRDGDVQLISLPDSPVAASIHAAQDVVVGFDSFGRTWHRQELLKARVVAGDAELGKQILARLEPWLFRRYFNRADETGLKALKRRIILEATLHQDDWRSVRLARGGLRDIETTTEFLQLLAGGEQIAARRRGTLAAIAGLQEAGTLTPDERRLLDESYQFFRQLEHRTQVFIDSAATELPAAGTEADWIVSAFQKETSVADFYDALRQRQRLVWQTLERLLKAAFPEEPPVAREVELLLDPAPKADEIRAALAPFGFKEPKQAANLLNELAAEQVPFLSTRRCRDLLAEILPNLLCAISETPTPDRTLDDLVAVSNSLGGKGVLWALFGASTPSMQLYVKLCAASPYLSGILTTNPGMIDELVDSLQLDKLPSRSEMKATLQLLSRGTVEPLNVLYDFKNAEHLRIGVREILGKEDVDRTHEALADVAESCLSHLAEVEYARLLEKFGKPTCGLGSNEGEPCSFAIVGLGKLGGREPNYHSPVDLLLLYEAEGTTRSTSRRVECTANNHFFTQLAQRVIKQLTQLTPKGRLYSVETSLRPIGVGGALALSFSDFEQHFAGGAAPLWHWLLLCQARAVYGDQPAIERIGNLLRDLVIRSTATFSGEELRVARNDLEKGAPSENLKRAPGGTADIEFLVQFLQLQHARDRPEVLTANTQIGLKALGAAGFLSAQVAEELTESYRCLRRVQSALGLAHATPRHDLPEDSQELAQLALLLGHSNPQRLRDQCLEVLESNRAAFDRLTAPGRDYS